MGVCANTLHECTYESFMSCKFKNQKNEGYSVNTKCKYGYTKINKTFNYLAPQTLWKLRGNWTTEEETQGHGKM